MYNPADPTFNLSYVRQRLEGTYVVVPSLSDIVYVQRVGHNGGVVYLDVNRHNQPTQRVSLTDAKLESPRLGYVDFDGNSWFTTRLPVRNDWRQGLRLENTASIRKGRSARFPFSLHYLKQPIFGGYHKIEDALDKIEDYFEELGLSRNFSVTDNFKVWYKGDKEVGKVNPDNGKVSLVKGKEWLKEIFEEEVGGVELT